MGRSMNHHSKVTQLSEDRPKFGFTDEELAALPTVYRDDLLAGQVMLVSGGGSGIGKGIAFLAARLGAELVLCGRSEDKLVRTADAIAQATGRRPMHMPMSIRDEDAVDALFDAIEARYGRLDHLVNNAGGQFPQSAIDMSRKGWRSVIDLNLNGTWWMMQAAAQRWRLAERGGSIINIVAHVERGMPQVAHTCAARAGVIYLSKTVSTEWAPLGIRVNCVAPGVIESEGFHVYSDEALARFHDANPMKRRGDVWDIAESVIYLTAASGKFVTGETIVVDGGMAQIGVVWPAGRPEYFGGAKPNGI